MKSAVWVKLTGRILYLTFNFRLCVVEGPERGGKGVPWRGGLFYVAREGQRWVISVGSIMVMDKGTTIVQSTTDLHYTTASIRIRVEQRALKYGSYRIHIPPPPPQRYYTIAIKTTAIWDGTNKTCLQVQEKDSKIADFFQSKRFIPTRLLFSTCNPGWKHDIYHNRPICWILELWQSYECSTITLDKSRVG